MEHPPMPAGVQRLLGALVTPTRAKSGPEYGITHVRVSGDDLVWLDSLVGRAGGAARWRVVDALRLPAMGEDDALVVQACRVADVADGAVIAIARRDTAPVLTPVRRAWRADLAARRFRALSTGGVTCDNEGYGV